MISEKQAFYRVNSGVVPISKIEKIVEQIVDRKLQELLSDPDYGFKLRAEFQQKLDATLKKRGKTIPANEVAQKYGVRL